MSSFDNWMPAHQYDMYVVTLQEFSKSTKRTELFSAIERYINFGEFSFFCACRSFAHPSIHHPLLLLSTGIEDGGQLSSEASLAGGSLDLSSLSTYSTVATIRFWDMALFVLVRTEYKHLISNIRTHAVPTGIGNRLGELLCILGWIALLQGFEIIHRGRCVWFCSNASVTGNKGAVGVSFHLGEIPVCFVGSHLAAREVRLSPSSRLSGPSLPLVLSLTLCFSLVSGWVRGVVWIPDARSDWFSGGRTTRRS